MGSHRRPKRHACRTTLLSTAAGGILVTAAPLSSPQVTAGTGQETTHELADVIRPGAAREWPTQASRGLTRALLPDAVELAAPVIAAPTPAPPTA
ncbi:MAG TPA: hypothetical protein VMZ00_14360, partial [Sporichthya sp.]|nr:hypothetical protein [Sporichthya sp.]